MDIILKPILSFIQGLDGMSNSILAGGAVRDTMFGLEPRDYDIFVPSKNKKHLADAINMIRSEFTTSDVVNKSKDYDIIPRSVGKSQNLLEVLNFKYKDRDIDIIGINADDDEDFPLATIESFDYGINMVYDTGRYIDDSHSKFRRDFDNHYMTLHRLEYLDKLPKAIQRFNNFNNRAIEHLGYTFYFDSPILRIQMEEDRKPRPLNVKSPSVWLDEQADPSPLDHVADTFGLVNAAPTAIPVQHILGAATTNHFTTNVTTANTINTNNIANW